jgi:hypothetical protein
MFPAAVSAARSYQSRLLRRRRWLCLIELGAVVVVNDIDDGIARVNPLKVLNVDGSDVSGNFGGERCRISLQIGIVGGLQHSRANPPVPLVGDNEDQTSDQK